MANAESGAGASGWASGIYAITLFVENLADATQFYREVFGLPVVYEDDNSAVFKFGHTLVNLLKISEAEDLIQPAAVAGPKDGSRLVFTIQVEDVDSMCAELTKRGVKLLNGPMEVEGTGRFAVMMDPQGAAFNVIKLSPNLV